MLSELNPSRLLQSAVRTVPAVRFALGVAGVAAAATIILSFLGSGRTSIIAVATMFIAMVILFIFSSFITRQDIGIKVAGWVLMFAVLAFVITFLVFTVLVFSIGSPKPFARFLGISIDNDAQENYGSSSTDEDMSSRDPAVILFHFSGDYTFATNTAAKLRQAGYHVPPIREDLSWCGRELRYFNEGDATLAVDLAKDITSILYESGFAGIRTDPKDLVDYSKRDFAPGTLELWISLPPRGDPPSCASAAEAQVHAQIFTHDTGLTKEDAIQIEILLEKEGIPTAIVPHIDRRAPDAAFIGALVTVDKGQIALSAAPYDIRYMFPSNYAESEGGDPDGFLIGLGYMSTHYKEFRKVEPVAISKSDLGLLLEPGISNAEFQRRLDEIYDREPTAAVSNPAARGRPPSR